MKKYLLAAMFLLGLANPALAQQCSGGGLVGLLVGPSGSSCNYLSVNPDGSINIENGSSTPIVHAQTATLAASLVAKASAGQLSSFQVQADSTLYASAWWLMVFDSATIPAAGTVTPAKCYPFQAGQPGGSFSFGTPVAFTAGISLAVSTTGCFSYTASTHAFIGADYE